MLKFDYDIVSSLEIALTEIKLRLGQMKAAYKALVDQFAFKPSQLLTFDLNWSLQAVFLSLLSSLQDLTLDPCSI